MHISGIRIYPIKSLHGIALESALVEDRGLTFDRRWMLIDTSNKFLTQREYPVMATVRVEICGDGLRVNAGGVRFDIEPPDAGESTRERVTIWSSKVDAAVYNGKVNDLFSELLGTEVRLAAMTDALRPVNYWYRVHKGDNVSFADGYPFLLAGEGSLEDLNRRIREASEHTDDFKPFPMDRFRPNFVVKGSEPFAEDTWKKIRIGSTVFHVVKPCGRCPIPTIDQDTGKRSGAEPIKTLSTFRTVRRGGKNKVLFGQNLIAEKAGGTVNVGDEVEILEYRNRRD